MKIFRQIYRDLAFEFCHRYTRFLLFRFNRRKKKGLDASELEKRCQYWLLRGTEFLSENVNED